MKTLRYLVIASLMAGFGFCVFADTHYVAQNGQTPSGSYASWANAASNIQEAVNAAAAGDTVLVGAGRYTLPPNPTNYVGTNVVYVNRSLTMRSSNGVPESTIIDGEGKYRGLTIYAPFVLDGFTISNCFATNQGGGLLVVQATGNGVMRNCIITDNRVELGSKAEGGGVWAGYTTPLVYNNIISNCTFRNNRAVGPGGGVFISTFIGYTLTTDSLFENNSATNGGGMYLVWGGDNYGLAHTVERCVIRGNSAGGNYGGGGVNAASPCKVVMRNCLMCENRATHVTGGYGGAFAHGDNTRVSTQEFYNCTIVSNMAPLGGGGVHIRDWSSVSMPCPIVFMYNTICCSNASDNIAMKAPPNYTNIILNSCSFPSNANFRMADTGNITSPPAFVNFAGQDFHLLPSSPTVNAGLNQEWMENAKDLENRSRIDRFSGRVDMGCYEYLPRGMMVKVR